MSNIRDVIEGRLPRSLSYVFAQLRLMGAKSAEDRSWPKRPLTPAEHNAIRDKLRRDLQASLATCEQEAMMRVGDLVIYRPMGSLKEQPGKIVGVVAPGMYNVDLDGETMTMFGVSKTRLRLANASSSKDQGKTGA